MAAEKNRLADELTGKVVIVGVGEVQRGDDGAGPMTAQLLAKSGVAEVIDSGASPELDTWRVREMSPDTVVFVDAVDFGGEPGDVALLRPSELRADGFDTHRAPLRLTMEYLESELGCASRLLAIQPKSVAPGAAMCDEVRQAVESVAKILMNHVFATTK